MQDQQLTTAWHSPSNIAIIKYWGKHGDQLPDNPSLSITLSKAFTETRLSARPLQPGESPGLTFRFEGKENASFAQRISGYIQRLSGFIPAVKNFHLGIDSENSFPHSSGIASSASAMSALALCLADLQSAVDGTRHDEKFLQLVSLMSRLGSGSACRSIYGPISLWGSSEMIPGSSDDYAIPLQNAHPVFHSIRDSILIIDDHTKPVSSSVGHMLMQGHPFAKARIEQARQNLKILMPALHGGDMVAFCRVAESEAMSLHAMMMTSDPAYMLIQPNTLQVLQRVKEFRESTGIPVCFTLDAGPNVHVLYPKEDEDRVRTWIEDELSVYCKDNRMIHDQAGGGPERM